jgi:hypothetical protein
MFLAIIVHPCIDTWPLSPLSSQISEEHPVLYFLSNFLYFLVPFLLRWVMLSMFLAIIVHPFVGTLKPMSHTVCSVLLISVQIHSVLSMFLAIIVHPCIDALPLSPLSSQISEEHHVLYFLSNFLYFLVPFLLRWVMLSMFLAIIVHPYVGTLKPMSHTVCSVLLISVQIHSMLSMFLAFIVHPYDNILKPMSHTGRSGAELSLD